MATTGAFRAVSISRPALAAQDTLTAILSAIGAAFIGGAVALLALDPVWSGLGPRAPLSIFEAAGFFGGIAAGATALAAGGRRSVIGYAAWALATAALPGCWSGIVGIPIGMALAPALRTGPRGANGTLEGAGTYAVLGTLFLPLGLLGQTGPALVIASAASVVITAAQALAAAYVIVRRAPAPAWSAAVIAIVVLARPAPLTISQLQVAFDGSWDRAPVFLLPLAAAALLFAGTFGFRRALDGVTRAVPAE